MIYPILQGYDSYMVQSDIAILGSDHLFNESMGRLLQEKHKKKPQTVIITAVTAGIDGHNKQSQRRDNDISLSHSPRDKFGRIMSIPDTIIEEYFRFYTDIPLQKIDEIKTLIREKPRDAKIELAAAIVERYHGKAAAREEREWFDSTISKGYIPDDLPKLILTTHHMAALDLVAFARPLKSKSDSRRLIEQGGIELNGRKLRLPKQELYLKDNDILQVGRRSWFHIEVEELPTFETRRLSIKAMGIRDIALVSQQIPQADISKYIVRFGNKKKKTADAVEDAFKKIILHPELRNEWLWSIADKKDPEKVIGIAYLRGDAREGLQNIWLKPDLVDETGLIDEVMMDLSEYALSRLDPKGEAFKHAFAYATAPRNIDTLYYAARVMDSAILAKADAPQGLRGFTYEGWDKMQEWRRITTPWLFKNDPSRLLDSFQNIKKNDPSPNK